MDKQREDFEAWVREYGNYPRRPELKTSDGAYHYVHTESEWRAWQAAQAAQPSQALELSDAEIKNISSDLSLYEDYQPESCQADYLDPVKFARAIIAVINAKEKQWLKEK